MTRPTALTLSLSLAASLLVTAASQRLKKIRAACLDPAIEVLVIMAAREHAGPPYSAVDVEEEDLWANHDPDVLFLSVPG